MEYIPTLLDRAIYEEISSNNGLKAREISRHLQVERTTVNRALFGSPLMQELCWQDRKYRWHSLIPATVPHAGMQEFSGYYSDVRSFLCLNADQWLTAMKLGCQRIGRNINDTRGLFHSFLDCRQTILQLFEDLSSLFGSAYLDWEIAFEFRLKKSRYIRIYSDVLIITPDFVFSLEFKMKDQVDPGEVTQAAKYVPFLELIFGRAYEVVPVLVLTKAADLYTTADIPGTEGMIPVCSGDMLFNIFDEYLRFISDKS